MKFPKMIVLYILNGIHYDGNQDEYVKEYADGDDEEEYNDDGGTEKEYIF